MSTRPKRPNVHRRTDRHRFDRNIDPPVISRLRDEYQAEASFARFSRGECIEIEKRQPFKPVTTRALYPGRHFAELLVNGIIRGKRSFELIA